MPRISAIVLVFSLLSTSWSNSKAASSVRVIATTTVVADLVEQVGGDLVVGSFKKAPVRHVLHRFFVQSVPGGYGRAL